MVKVYLLMEDNTPIGAYLDLALANTDCWDCLNRQHYLDSSNIDYWVKEVELVTEFGERSPHEC